MPAKASHPLSAQIGKGSTWEVNDIAWSDGDVLLVGSSSLRPVSRVFLRSRATKIGLLPVPVVVVPRVSSRIRHRANP